MNPKKFLIFSALLATCGFARAQDAGAFLLHNGDRVVFYGDSITQDGGYANLVESYTRTRFPAWDLRFYYSGVGGDTVSGGAGGDITTRIGRDVIALNPSVVTIMLGMNDGRYRPLDASILDPFSSGYRAIVDRIEKEAPKARIFPILPSPFDDVTRKPQFAGGYDQCLRRLGGSVEEIAKEHHLTTVDFGEPLNAALARLSQRNLELAQTVLPDRVHPSAAGHLILGVALLRAWHAPSVVTRVCIDAPSGKILASENTAVSHWEQSPGHWSWRQLDAALPLPLNFDEETMAIALEAGTDLESLDQEPLCVTGLAPGSYSLKVDETTLGTFTSSELAKGINLARINTPMRWQAYTVLWGAGSSHETQRVRRNLMASGFPTAGESPAAQTLAAFDEKSQKDRQAGAVPKEHTFTLAFVPESPAPAK